MVKVAQIGCGYWGKNLASNFGRLGTLAAIVDADPTHAEALAEQFGVGRPSLEEVLQDPEIEACSFATPAETHAAMVRQALLAGKHVFVEKPLALKREEAEELVTLATQRKQVLMVGHLLHYHPLFAEMKRLVQGGKVGTIRYLYSNRLSLGKFRMEENVLWSFAPHDVSMLLALTREKPRYVSATGYNGITPGIADWCTVGLTFPSGIRGHIQASWLHPFKEHRLVVVGDEGMMVFEDSSPYWERKLAFYPSTVSTNGAVPIPNKAEAQYIDVPRDEPLKLECQHFADCIRTGKKPITDGAEGLAVLDVLTDAEKCLSASLEKA